jgi:DNA-binding beta-propeller fold protein YncE
MADRVALFLRRTGVIAELVTGAALLGGAGQAPSAATWPVALVTAESENALLAVSVRSGRVLRRVALPPDPENVEVHSGAGPAVVVSTKAGEVSLVDTHSLRVRATFTRFRQPHIAATSPDGGWVYVSDDGTGRVSVIDLRDWRVVARIYVGIGAHHMTVSPDGGRLWIALGERATTVVVVDVSNPQAPRVLGRFSPPGSVHDLAFGPRGKTVWLTSATSERILVVDSLSGNLLFTVAAGAPPQHVAFSRHFAYVSSGYDGMIERVDARSGQVLQRAAVPYGSFNLAISGRIVVTSSLLDGTVSRLTRHLRVRATYQITPAARDVGVVHW